MRHPSLARERFNRPLQGPSANRITDRAIGSLLEAGLSNEEAAAAFKALLISSLGAAAIANAEAVPEVREEAARRNASVTEAELPAMAAVADELTTVLGGDDAFELGLAALLDGIELRAAR
jgi:hypothetical protein